MPRPPYIRKACNCPNAAFVSLLLLQHAYRRTGSIKDNGIRTNRLCFRSCLILCCKQTHRNYQRAKLLVQLSFPAARDAILCASYRQSRDVFPASYGLIFECEQLKKLRTFRRQNPSPLQRFPLMAITIQTSQLPSAVGPMHMLILYTSSCISGIYIHIQYISYC